jgi:hypothetical protein
MTEQTGLQNPMADPGVDHPRQGMSAQTATRVEFGIIGLSIVALLLIFQPFSLALFGVGCGVVVVSGLANNLLPLCQPGIPVRSLVNGGLIVGGIFVAVLILAIASAYLYGRVFVGR